MPSLHSIVGLLTILLTTSVVHAQQNPRGQMPLTDVNDPLIWLVRDSVVHDDLGLPATQRAQLRALGDEIDAQIWPARNQGPEKSLHVWEEQSQWLRTKLPEVVSPAHLKRLDEIILRIQGLRALQRDDLAELMKLTGEQRTAINRMLEETRTKLAELRAKAEQGEDARSLQREADDFLIAKQTAILELIAREQRYAWRRAMGDEIDVQKLGFVDFRAPRLQMDYAQWLSAEASPFTQKKVTIIHFFACGCINCQRNYAHYRDWDEQYRDRGVQVVGIHTPETSQERDFEFLKSRVEEAQFQFPVLVDNRSENWNAWGNSMWPSVYVIDQKGRVRAWWIGELNWQGANGDEQLEEMIEKILEEEEDE